MCKVIVLGGKLSYYASRAKGINPFVHRWRDLTCQSREHDMSKGSTVSEKLYECERISRITSADNEPDSSAKSVWVSIKVYKAISIN